jgi:hypothetical protein
VYDKGRAVWQWVGYADTVEEAARMVDTVSIAYCGPREANTNFPVPHEECAEPAHGYR